MSIDPQKYEPPLSLWNIINEHIAENEHYEVKNCLGEDLIEQSKELREEIHTVLEILSDVRAEASAGGDTGQAGVPRLPEPPHVRDRLTQEIVFFLEGIREQARLQGRDVSRILHTHNRDVIDYAYESGSSRPSTTESSRPSTSRSSSMRVSPLSSRSGSTTTRDFDVGAMKDKLNYLNFDEVRLNLRQYLQEEVNQLTTDLAEIQMLLCETESSRTRCPVGLSREPTLSELREERSRLERMMIDSARDPPNLPNTGNKPLRPGRGFVPTPVKAKHTFIRSSPMTSPSPPTTPDTTLVSPPRGTHNCHVPTLPGQTTSPSFTPSPPPSSSSRMRPGSANRFRKMILECRETSPT